MSQNRSTYFSGSLSRLTWVMYRLALTAKQKSSGVCSTQPATALSDGSR